MSSHFQLRLTTAGRAALADGANIGINAVRYTKVAIGSGSGPGGEADDGRAALRNERDSAPVMGSTEVAGQVAVCGFVMATAAYQVREVGLFGRVGDSGAEALHAYWTDPSDIFAAAAEGSQVIVAGSLAIGPLAAGVTLSVDASVTLQSQGLLPHWLLPGPHANTAAHALDVTAAASAAGGTVSVAAGADLSIARAASPQSTTGFVERFRTAAWQSADLPANATHYLRARVTAAGALQFYIQGGTDADDTPASLTGAPDAAAGGGFSSTPLDARAAKIVTGSAGSVPEITKYRLEARPPAGIEAWLEERDYAHPSAAWGSDGELYASVQASGPSTAAGALDPTGDGDYSHWRPALLTKGLAEAAPAKDDWLRFGDRDAAGPGKDSRVEIRKLPAALAPSAGVVQDKKYALKALAGGVFELARFVALATVATAAFTVSARGGGSYPQEAVVGDVLNVPAGTYTVLMAWSRPNNQASLDVSGAKVYLEWRPGSSGMWQRAPDFTIRERHGFYVSIGVTAYRFRTAWEFAQDSQVRMLATLLEGWTQFSDCALLMVEEA